MMTSRCGRGGGRYHLFDRFLDDFGHLFFDDLRGARYHNGLFDYLGDDLLNYLRFRRGATGSQQSQQCHQRHTCEQGFLDSRHPFPPFRFSHQR